MELLVLDKNLVALGIVDSFASLIWTDRYNVCGDFEIYGPASKELMALLQPDYYLYNRDSEHLMIIDTQDLTSDTEKGTNLKITGRSLESILDRRIIWNQTILTGNLQNGIETLLNENAINPIITDRKINRLVFLPSTDPVITSLTVEGQNTGGYLYDVITSLCIANDIGFKITLSDSGDFVFQLYTGVDRSYSQELNPYVVFSPNFENIIKSNYFESRANLKTVVLVAGEGDGADRKTKVASITSGAGTDLDRREMFADARDISTTIDGGTLTDEEYQAQLEERGIERLAENTVIKSFDGQVDTSSVFVYGVDFSMGDIVQKANEFGQASRVRITELIFSEDITGYGVYPTFSSYE